MSQQQKLSVSGVGGFSFVLRIPKQVATKKDVEVSLKVSDATTKQAKNEIRVLQFWRRRESRGMIRSLYDHVSSPHNICYILMPNYDASLLDLILVPSLQRFLPRTVISANIVLITTQLVDAVQFMRDNAMAHRDIKLDNILVKLNPVQFAATKVVLTDFGDSCIENENSGDICGTTYYMAPELFYEAALGKRKENVYTMQIMQHADVFSLGQSILLLLTHRAQRTNTILPAQGYINERFGNEHRSRELKLSSGMFLTDVTCTTSSQNLFTETILNWGCMNPNERKTYPFDQKDEMEKMLDSLVSMSQSSEPVFKYKFESHKLSIENIRDRYVSWKDAQST